jgi:VWFA-related protein
MRTIAIAFVLSMIAAAPALAQFEETITVARVLVDVRVTDDRGNPVTGLTPDDFIVKIGDAPARVESATFIDESLAAYSDDMAGEMAAAPADATEPIDPQAPQSLTKGRLFIVFVQTDFARNQSRVAGQMHFNRYAGHFIESLLPDDRVAVFSFDSHLKFRLDFTSDKEIVADAIRRALLIDEPPPPPIVHTPALASRLDRDAMKRVTSSESALLLVGNALMPIDGPKNLILMGWGLGERTPTGRYELEIRLPASITPGTHDLTIRTKRRNTTILAPSTITSR